MHIWDILDSRIRQRNPPPQTLYGLFLASQNELRFILQHTIRNRVASMRCYCATVIATRREHPMLNTLTPYD